MIIDTFMFSNEIDMLTCRLTEIGDVVDVVIAVESDVDHQNNPKPYVLTENIDRFERWWDKLIVVRATDLPTDPNPWTREHAQREWIGEAIRDLPGVSGSDIVLQSDVDEIPRALNVRNVRPGSGLAVFEMRFHPFCVDWIHPHPWQGTVAATVDTVAGLGRGADGPFTVMRDARLWSTVPAGYRDAGWHFTWVGQDPMAKIESFCHPEVYDHIVEYGDRFATEGIHVDGLKLDPVDVDSGWPKWIRDGHAPDSWFRPRAH